MAQENTRRFSAGDKAHVFNHHCSLFYSTECEITKECEIEGVEAYEIKIIAPFTGQVFQYSVPGSSLSAAPFDVFNGGFKLYNTESNERT